MSSQAAAWVYGLMSFGDKVSGGIALLLLQRGLREYENCQVHSHARAVYLRNILVFVPAATALVAFVAGMPMCRVLVLGATGMEGQHAGL